MTTTTTTTTPQTKTTKAKMAKASAVNSGSANNLPTAAKAREIDADQKRREDELVREHLPLVGYVVAEIAHRVPGHVSRNDLVSAGMMGLAQAARTFDPDRGIAFDRFASTRIRGALLDELRGRDWASRSIRARARGMQHATEDLTNKLGRTPTQIGRASCRERV